MKKTICILLLLATVFSASLALTGCGKEPSEGNPNATGIVLLE